MAKMSVATVLAVAAMLGAGAAGANVLVNGGFESEPNFALGSQESGHYTVLTGTQIPGWTIEPNHAVTVHFVGTYPTITGSYSVNMDGEGQNSNNANFYQDFASTGGQQYQLQYDWYGWVSTAVHLDVTVTDTVTAVVLYHGDIAWVTGVHHVSATFAGTGHPLRLRIQENPQTGFNDDAFIVDNFTVDAGGVIINPLAGGTTAPVPTLDQWGLGVLLCLLSLAAVVSLRKRTR